MKRMMIFIVVLLSLSVLTTGCRNVPDHVVSISPIAKTILASESAMLAIAADDHTSTTWPEKTGDMANYTQTGDTVVGTPPTIVDTHEFTLKAEADSAMPATSTITTIERKIVRIATSEATSYVLLNDGSLWGTGSNKYRTLGKTDGDYVVNFVKVFDSGIADVSPGKDFCFVLKTDGSLWGTGLNHIGQLGTGDRFSKDSYEKIPLDGVIAVSVGGKHSLALKADGSVWATGDNEYGQLGTSDRKYRNIFAEVIAADSSDSKVIAVSAGREHSLALKADGSVWAAGRNDYGQLGTNDWGPPLPPPPPARTTRADDYDRLGTDNRWWRRSTFTAVITPDSSDAKVVAISAGDYHSLALKADGSIWAAGRNSYGQLGADDSIDRNTFTKIMSSDSSDPRVVAVSAGREHSLALKSDGSVWATGSNYQWQLGTGDRNYSNKNTFTETIASDSSDSKVIAISAGRDYSLALKADGSVCATGNNDVGQLGTGDRGWTREFSNRVRTPNQFVSITPTEKTILAGESVTLTVTSGNVSITWPEKTNVTADYTRTGDKVVWTPPAMAGTYHFIVKMKADSARDAMAIIKVRERAVSERPIVKIAASGDTSYAIFNDGSLWNTGYRYFKALGKTGDNHVDDFVKVLDSAITDVFPGNNFCFVLKTDGSLWGAGLNNRGQLGTGDNSDRYSYEKIPLDNVIAVSAERVHSLALKSDGSVWATGDNDIGQLGISVGDRRYTFTEVIGADSRVIAIATGVLHSLALKSDGSVLAAGYNHWGQLGTKDRKHRNTFTEVIAADSSDSKIIAISAGDYHSLALKSDGSVWAAGRNHRGQLGTNDLIDRNTFTRVMSSDSSGSKVIAIAAGVYHSLILKDDGSVWATGRNDRGQLGTGDRDNRNTFVEVIRSDSANAKVIAIVAGSGHSLALKADGSIWATGDNEYGQLGTGTKTNLLEKFTLVAGK